MSVEYQRLKIGRTAHCDRNSIPKSNAMVISHSFSKASSFPGAYQTLYDQGRLLLNAGHYKEAVAYFDRAIAILPDQPTSWYYHGDALAHLTRYEEALFSFERVLALEPEHQQAWAFRGTVLIYLKRYMEALESCDRALTLQPDDAETWVMRGVALQRLKQYKKAYVSYGQAMGVERKPLSNRVTEPLLAFKHIRRLLPIQPASQRRQPWAMVRQFQKRIHLNEWTVSIGFSTLLLTAIVFVEIISWL